MYSVVAIIAPIFTLILLGYIAGRLGWLSASASKGLTAFTFSLAIPAMLFMTMTTAEFPNVQVYQIWGAFFSSAAVIWIISTLATGTVLRRPMLDSPFISMNASFGNVVMLGIPLAMSAWGAAAAAPLAVLVSLHSVVLWTVATVHYVLVRRESNTPTARLILDVLRDLSRNIIILAIIAGSLWRITGIGLHPLVEQPIHLLGQAAIPCALVALGLSLVEFRIKGQAPTLALVLVLKNIAMPFVAWVFATQLFTLSPVEVGVVVLCAATPAGANAFVFASRYSRAVNSASGAVALGVMMAVVTIGTTLYFLQSV